VVPNRDDVSSVLGFTKRWLKRTSSLSSVEFWAFIAGSATLGTGFALATTAPWQLHASVFILAIVGFFLQKQRNDRMRLRQIEALFDRKPLDQ
jgi:hypothetical protein